MELILADPAHRSHLLPLAFTRPVAEFRVGILTLREKWEHHTGLQGSWLTEPYLQAKYPMAPSSDMLVVNGAVCCNAALGQAATVLQPGEVLIGPMGWLAYRASQPEEKPEALNQIVFQPPVNTIHRLWDLFLLNGAELNADFDLLTRGRTSATLSATNTLLGERIFAEPGARVEGCILNATSGPIYLGADSEVMEGSMIRGGFALLDHSQVKLGTKVYGPTTVGPHSRIGGEVNNAVIFGYSNKGHDGFLGNAVLGEWVNMGADSNNSNLKNNYDEVKLWSYPRGGFERTGQQFCGLIMADHSKCGINTMFNTGTVVGVSCNVFGAGFPRNFIPDFTWGGSGGLTLYQTAKAFETAQRVMERRGLDLTPVDQAILQHVYDQTESLRKGMS
jgi:UDP-N-acetylglucosamine diphosphorylase/glucosamine-1-phosphate N-acetyltransferase